MRYGIIEDVNDPEMLGRARVRVLGIHNWDRSVLPTEDLQWAIVMNPTTTPGVSGKGASPFLLNGSWVAVEFMDNDLQIPIIVGTFRGKPSTDFKTPDESKNETYVTDSSGNVVTDSTNQPIITEASTTEQKAVVDGWFLGRTSVVCETGTTDMKKAVLKINDYNGRAKGDAGGASYGAFQFASYCPNKPVAKSTILNSPVKRLCRKYYPELDTLSPGTSEFDQKWKSLVSNDINKAVEAQSAIGKEKYYTPMVKALRRAGLVLDNRGPGVQDLIFATCVHMWTKTFVFTEPLKGKDLSTLSDADIINLVCDYKMNNVNRLFKSSSQSIRNNIAKNRFGPNGTERKLCLALCGSGNSASEKSPLGTKDDPEGKYPSYTNESDVSRLARNSELDHTSQNSKSNTELESTNSYGSGKIQDEGSGSNFSEPKSPYNAKYPYNHVTESSSGHVIELDDTPSHERVHIYHRSGSFVEFHPDGKLVIKSINDNFTVALQDYNLYCDGELNIVCKNNANIVAKGDVNVSTENAFNLNAVGNVLVNTNGKFEVSADNGIFLNSPNNIGLTSNGKISLDATGNISHRTNSDMINVVNGNKVDISNGNQTSVSQGDMYLISNGVLGQHANGKIDIASPNDMTISSSGTAKIAGNLMTWQSGGNIEIIGTNMNAHLGSGQKTNVETAVVENADTTIDQIKKTEIDAQEIETFSVPDGADPDVGFDQSSIMAPIGPVDSTPVSVPVQEEIKKSSEMVIENAKDTEKSTVSSLTSFIADGSISALSSLAKFDFTTITESFSSISKLLDINLDKIISLLKDLSNSASSNLSTINIDSLKSLLAPLEKIDLTNISECLDFVSTFDFSSFESILSTLKNVDMSSISNGIDQVKSAANSSLGLFAESATKAVSGSLSSIQNLAKNNPVANKLVSSASSGVSDLLSSASSSITDSLSKAISGIDISSIGNSLGSLSKLKFDDIISQVNVFGMLKTVDFDLIVTKLNEIGKTNNIDVSSLVGILNQLKALSQTDTKKVTQNVNTLKNSNMTQVADNMQSSVDTTKCSGKEPVCWHNQDVPKLKEFSNSLKLTENITLGMMLNGRVTTSKLPTSQRTVKRKNSKGQAENISLTAEDFVLNLQKVALYVLEPIKKFLPDVWNKLSINSTLRNGNNYSQHNWGQGVDLQVNRSMSLNDQLALFDQVRKLLLSRNGWDQMIIEYLHGRNTANPVLHISFSDGEWKHPRLSRICQYYTSYSPECKPNAKGIADKNGNQIY